MSRVPSLGKPHADDPLGIMRCIDDSDDEYIVYEGKPRSITLTSWFTGAQSVEEADIIISPIFFKLRPVPNVDLFRRTPSDSSWP